MLTEVLAQEAYGFAERKDIESAIKIVDILKVLGMGDKEIEALRRDVGIAYLKRCKTVKLGVVEPYALCFATVDTKDEYESVSNQYIGLSPDAQPTFKVIRPVYYKDFSSQKVLYPRGKAWYYMCLKDGGDYGGIVMQACDGVYWVLPYFNLEEIKMLAQECIRELGDVDSHTWERPANFLASSAEWKYAQQVQSELACKYHGLAPSE
jgi:hypothetical protein